MMVPVAIMKVSALQMVVEVPVMEAVMKKLACQQWWRFLVQQQ